MDGPTAHSMSKMFTQLTALQVSFTSKPRSSASKTRAIFGVYNRLPTDRTILMKADLPLLASLGGALVGLPDSSVKERIQGVSLDETMRDAIHEVLNITSTLLSAAHRVVFKTMYTEATDLTDSAQAIVKSAVLAHCFDVSIQGYTGGELGIFAEF